jgi:lipoprotein signal peptidase
VSGARARAWWLAGARCVGVVIVDQAAKTAIRDHLVVGQEVEVLGPLKLTLTHNSGVAFGFAGGAGIRIVLLTLVALGVVGYFFARNPTRPWMWLAVGLVAGGALGNLVDRIRYDVVTDYIDLPSWPPFNLADMSIIAGVLLLVLINLRDSDADRGPEQGDG